MARDDSPARSASVNEPAEAPTIAARELKAIFGGQKNKSEFLFRLDPKSFKSSGTAKYQHGRKQIDLDQEILRRWDPETATPIIREMYFESEKAQRAAGAGPRLESYRAELADRGFDPQEQFGPSKLSQMMVQWVRTNRDDLPASFPQAHKRMEHILLARAINEARNDLLEDTLLRAHPEVAPTLTDTKGMDYLIRIGGVDQKVTRGVGEAFKKKHGPGWRQIAKQHPDLVAQSLYENQDPGEMYGTEPRLFIVFLDGDVSAGTITRTIADADLSNPLEVSFDDKDERSITTPCFVVFLERD